MRLRKSLTADRANPFHQVLAFVGLGDKDRAFEALERMASQGPMRVGVALSCPETRNASRGSSCEGASQRGRVARIAISHRQHHDINAAEAKLTKYEERHWKCESTVHLDV